MRKILVFRIGAIGDVLMTTPFIRALKQQYNSSKITYMTGNWSKDVLNNNPFLNKIIPIDESIIFKKRPFKILHLVSTIRKMRFDEVYILDKSIWFSIIMWLARIPKRIGFNRTGEGRFNTHNVSFDGTKHEIECYLDLLTDSKKKKFNTQMNIYFDAKNEENVKELFAKINAKNKEPIIGLAPGGAKNPGQTAYIKRWPKHNYAALIQKLEKLNCTVLLFGGSDDCNLCEELSNQRKNIHNLAGKYSINSSAAIMKKCDAFITHDSGLMHIASAVKIPLICLFGPTPKERFAPINSFVLTTKSPPCYTLQGKFNNCTPDQMSEISVTEVISVLKKILDLK